MELLNRRKCTFNFLVDVAKIFFKEVVSIYTPTDNMGECGRVPEIFSNVVLSDIFLFANLLGKKWCLISIFITLLMSEVEHLFTIFKNH